MIGITIGPTSSSVVNTAGQVSTSGNSRQPGSLVTSWFAKSSVPTDEASSAASGSVENNDFAALGPTEQSITPQRSSTIPFVSYAVLIPTSPAQKLLQPSRAKERSQADLRGYVIRPITVSRQKTIDKAILQMIVLAFNIVQNRGFLRLLAVLDSTYKVPSRSYFTTTLLQSYYDEIIIKVEEMLLEAEYISLTTDTWTSNSPQSFMAVTAHYVSKFWKPVSVLLGCFKMNESHTAENLRNLLIELVKRWKLERKIVSISTDTAFNIIAAIRLTGWEHVPCFAHKLNLVVQDSVNDILPIIKKVRSIVEHFHRSTTATSTFAAMQKSMVPTNKTPLRLIMDVKTRLV